MQGQRSARYRSFFLPFDSPAMAGVAFSSVSLASDSSGREDRGLHRQEAAACFRLRERLSPALDHAYGGLPRSLGSLQVTVGQLMHEVLGEPDPVRFDCQVGESRVEEETR